MKKFTEIDRKYFERFIRQLKATSIEMKFSVLRCLLWKMIHRSNDSQYRALLTEKFNYGYQHSHRSTSMICKGTALHITHSFMHEKEKQVSLEKQYHQIFIFRKV